MPARMNVFYLCSCTREPNVAYAASSEKSFQNFARGMAMMQFWFMSTVLANKAASNSDENIRKIDI
eukprot:2688145-Pleurochrysis_carterae.AAC.4